MKIRSGFVSNSSSASFIVGSDKTIKQVEKILKRIVSGYNIMTGESYSEDMFDVFIAGNETVKMFADYNVDKKYVKDHIIIMGNGGDNSIPYDMFDMIEGQCQATHYHLG